MRRAVKKSERISERRNSGRDGRAAFEPVLRFATIAAFLAEAILAWSLIAEPSRRQEARDALAAAPAPPDVAPVTLLDLAPDRARSINAAIPFSKAPLVPARPFRFYRDSPDFDRARDCLAAAAWYEAGDDAAGERSVVQVVLNRLTHPAFPKTVCGVVFQGQERASGCQFTFTCDGALVRRIPGESAWLRAQEIASAALDGAVDRSVGLATHYHTDWVVPDWSGSLDKIAQVGTHLFFRFRGFWGKPAAMHRPAPVAEPVMAKLAMLSPVHGSESEQLLGMPPPGDADILSLVARLQRQAESGQLGQRPPLYPARPAPLNPELKGNTLAASDPAKGLFGLTLDLNRAPGSYVLVARTLCGERARCSVLGWRRGSAPMKMAEFGPKRSEALFSYQRTGKSIETSLWDCREMPRPFAQCLSGTAPAGGDPAAAKD